MTKSLTHLAKGLRKRSTDVERLVWSYPRAGRFEGLKFRRQQPLGPYIVDFVCFEQKLIIELDGGHHALADHIEKDGEPDAWLEKEGYTVLRFSDNVVLMNTRGVLDSIRERLYKTPSPQGRGSDYPHKIRKSRKFFANPAKSLKFRAEYPKNQKTGGPEWSAG